MDRANKSPTGLAWGYGGSGSGQLALAILADHLQDNQDALRLYQAFKWRVIADLDRESWTFTPERIGQVLEQIRHEAESVPG